MKSQVYSKQDQFKRLWTTPDRLPHKDLWLWDSVFHSFGNWVISEQLSQDSILAIFDSQKEDGFIPHQAAPNKASKITQPPIIAYGVLRMYERTGDKEVLKQVYPKLEKYLKWNMENRMNAENGLFVWHVNRTRVNNRCDECGMDNSPRFDNVTEMDCIDFSCFMAAEADAMAEIGRIIGHGSAEWWEKYSQKLKKAINDILWDERDNFYYDRTLGDKALKRVKSIASFLPLYAGVCDAKQAEVLVQELKNPKTFFDKVGIPSISKEEATFGEDMWRGPVWINYNYLIIKGLERYNYIELARELTQKLVKEITREYMSDGVFYEFYASSGEMKPYNILRKGKNIQPYNFHIRLQCIRDFGWTASLFVAMILEHREWFNE